MILLNDKSAREAICKALDIKNSTLSMALSFQRNSPTAAQAREMALQHGGILMEEKPASRTVRILNAKGETVKTY